MPYPFIIHCGLHNLASFSAFSGSDCTLNTSNSFQPLLYEYDSIANNVHINHPLASSTPTKASTPPSHRTSLRCLEIHCDSIQSSERLAVFTSIIANQDPDIVFGCESKLSPEDPTYSSFPPNYNVFRKERVNSGGGGIFIAVKSSIPASELLDISKNPEDESLWASVHLAKQKTLYICAFYKPPSASSSRLDYLSESILKVFNANKKSHPYIVVSGDFNCGDIDWKCDPPVVTNHSTAPLMNKLLDLINDHALTQHVTVSTRPASLKTLDLVLSSVPSLISDVNVRPGMSDHDLVVFKIKVKPHRAPRPRRKVYLHHKADLEALRREMSTRPKEFFELCSSRDLESNWTFFKNTLLNAVDKHVPSKMSPTKVSLPWITKSLKRHMRKRDRLYKKAKRSGNNKCTPAWKDYRSQRNKVVQLLKSAHNSYLDNVIRESLQDNPQRFWSYVKLARTENIGVPTLRQGESPYISEKDKADALNKYFESVFTKDDGVLPDSSPTVPAHLKPMGDILFSQIGFLKLLANLNPSKSAGPDAISSRCLRDLATEISGMLTYIFQQSFNTGSIPKDWSTAMVVPVHKKSNKDNRENYRTISLTCLCCKTMEHIVLSQLNDHLSRNNILSSLQHGFRARLSCETQLVLTFHDWANILNQRGQVDALFLDFSKAFDKVSHEKLLHKICQYGINGRTHAWISAFLKKPFPVCCSEWCTFLFCASHFWRTTGLRPRAHPFLVIYQRHCGHSKFSATSLCRRHSPVPGHKISN